MKKSLPLMVIAISILLLFTGLAGAAILDEPLELEEGMVGITSYTDEPEEDVVGSGIEGEVVIISIGEGEEVILDGDMAAEESATAKNLTTYLVIAGLVIMAFIIGRNKSTCCK